MDYMNELIITKILVNKNRCECVCSLPPEFTKYLKEQNKSMFFEVPETYDLGKVPPALLMVPFVGNMLPLAIFLGVKIKVPFLDANFYNALPKIELAYRKMFPYLDLKISLEVSELVTVSHDTQNKSLFFTGGLDATSALIETIEQKPVLINIWGGDIFISDEDSHKSLENYLSALSQKLGTRYLFIKTNFREYYDEWPLQCLLDEKIKKEDNHGWWASVSHILSMATTIAPVAFLENIGENYIGSSYNAKGTTFDANNDMMVQAITFASCHFTPIDSNYDRSAKAKKVVEYSKRTGMYFQLKVCWYRKAGENCSNCEKCYRTILDIISSHGNPNDYGFCVTRKTLRKIREFVTYSTLNESFWLDIQNKFREESAFWITQKDMAWILKVKINGISPMRLRLWNLKKRLERKISKLFGVNV